MHFTKYAIGAVVGVAATLGVLGARDYLRPSDPILVVNQSAQPLTVTYALESKMGEWQLVVPAGQTRSIPGALAFSDLHALEVDHKSFANWRVNRDAGCEGNCRLVWTAEGKPQLGA